MPSIGAGIGVPTGGTLGQVLTKRSNAAFDTDWEAGGGGSGGAVYWDTPEAHGAAGDGATDDAAAIQAAIDAASGGSQSGEVRLNPTKTYAVSTPILMRDGVRLVGGPDWKISGAKPGGRLVPLATFPTDRYVIEQATDSDSHLTDAEIVGIAVTATAPTSTSSRRWGGIKVTWGNFCKISGCSIWGTSLPAINLVDGVGCTVTNNGVQYFTQYRTLTANEAAVIIGGTDHYVAYNQCNGGDNSSVQYPSTFYRAGLLVNGNACWFVGNNGEYADVGIKVVGDGNTFLGDRGDFNAGRGIMFEGGVGNGCSQLKVIADSVASTGTYDGIYFDVNSYANTVEGVISGTITGVRFRNIVNDQANTGTNTLGYPYNPNTVSDIKANWTYVTNDVYTALVPYQSTVRPGASAPQFRPAARWSAGAAWMDTTNNVRTFSDGTNWRDAAGDVVGNRLTPAQAMFIGQTVGATSAPGWTASGCTFTLVDAHTAFSVPTANQFAVTSAGVTAGSAGGSATGVSCKPGDWFVPVTYARSTGPTCTVSVSVTWLDASAATIATSGATSITATSTAAKILGNPVQAPFGAAFAVLNVLASRASGGLTTSDRIEQTRSALVPGNWATDYVEV